MSVVQLKNDAPWIPAGNLVPTGVYEGPCVIQAANPDAEFIHLGPGTVLHDVSIHDAYGAQNPLSTHNKPNGPRSVTYLENAHDTDMISTHWHGTAVYISGGIAGVDSPVMILRSRGALSACLFAEAHEKTYGFHAWAIEQSKGLLVEHLDEADGIWITAREGAKPRYGSLTMVPKADVRSIHVQPDVPTTTDVQLTSEHKTEGAWIALYHTASRFMGSLFHANMGNADGEFCGLIFDVMNRGRAVFRVDAHGDVTEGRLAERIKELEVRLEALEKR